MAEATRGKLILAFATVYLVWGSTYLAIRYAIETMPPFLMASARFVVAGVLLMGWALLRGAGRPTLAQWRSTAVVGTLLLLGGNGGVVWAEQFVPSGLAALLVATVPLWMVLIDALAPGGKFPGLRVWIGIALGLVGVAILARPEGGPGVASSMYFYGALALIGASLSWSIGSVYARRAKLPPSPLLATGMEMLSGGVALGLFSLVLGEPRSFDLQAVSAKSWFALLYLLILGSIVGYSAYIYLLHATTPALASTYAYVNPVIAVGLGWAIAGEPVSARTLVAAAIILVGVVVITLSRRNNGLKRGRRKREAPAEGGG